MPERLSNYSGYDGAPSISPDGTKIIFESFDGFPDGSEGTSITLLNL
jgi:Tol biopolymer transport system component